MTADPLNLKYAMTNGSDDQILAALHEMRESIPDGEPWFFDLAKEHIGSDNNDIRWQSLIVIGEYIPLGQKNEDIWNVILQYCGVDDDMQYALATVLLEHLLEYDFDQTLEKIKTAPACDTVAVLGLLRRCSQFGQAKSKWSQIQQLIQN